MKQSKLRRRRVIRYAVLYFTLLIVFIALLVGPGVGAKMIITKDFEDNFNSILPDFPLLQPNNNKLKDNTLNRTETGTKAASYSGIGTASRTTAAAAEQTGNDDTSDKKFRFL
jgi:1,3-beta-glucan synthase